MRGQTLLTFPHTDTPLARHSFNEHSPAFIIGPRLGITQSIPKATLRPQRLHAHLSVHGRFFPGTEGHRVGFYFAKGTKLSDSFGMVGGWLRAYMEAGETMLMWKHT